ncbi:MAG: methyl-accepting chemotaxis protein [Clostridia bacterium]|nr:MAG: methyl-accepting chemotaxis protein [Clostridia bacterium]
MAGLRLFSSQSLATRLIVPMVIIVVVAVGGVMTWLVRQQRQQVIDEQVSRLRTVATQMNIARDYMASVQSRDYANPDFVPIVVAMRTGAKYAETAGDGLVVRTPSDKPRNPKNTADPWELKQLARFKADPNLPEVYEITKVDNTQVLRYAMPVRVTEDCLVCHGFPVGEKDRFGYAKEGYQVGDIRALYSLYIPTAVTDQLYRNNLIQLYGVGLLVILLIIAAVILLTRSNISRPLGAITAQLREINQGRGDLSRRLQFQGADEVGTLACEFNQFVDNLASMVSSLNDVAAHVASISSEVAQASTQTGMATQEVALNIEQLAQRIADLTDQVLASKDEVRNLADTAGQVADNARQAARAASQSAASARHGEEALKDAVGGMQEINRTVNEAAATVNELGERSKEIGQILEMIQNFAAETKLLALNAAIEAARAGDAGRGFSVVAEEVRKLAEESSRAAARIADMVSQIQNDTCAAAAAMGQGTEKTNEGLKLIAQARAALQEIVAAAQETDLQIQAISQAAGRLAASNQQVAQTMQEVSQAAEEISTRATNISAAAEEQTAAVEEISASANSLASDAETLNTMVQRFQSG